MHRGLLWFLAMIPTSMPGAIDTAPRWSPNGRWLAYSVAAPADPSEAASGWLLGGGPGPAQGWSATGLVFRVIVSEIASGHSVVLDESREPLSAPAWRPDGLALVFGRVATQPDGRVQLDYVTQDGLRTHHVVASQTLAAAAAAPLDLLRFGPTWSPDGRHLAVPGLRGIGFSVVRADNGRLLKSVDDGLWPAWSPDGSRLAYVGATQPAALLLLDAGFGPSRKLVDVGQVYGAPCWSRDGRWLRLVTGRPEQRRFGNSSVVELVRVDAESGVRELITTLSFDPVRGGRTPLAVSYTLDQDGEDLFFAGFAESQPSSIVWFRPKTGETVNRFHPIDYATRVGGLALSSSGRMLAFRLGSPDATGPVGVWETATGRLTPLVPDDAARASWVNLLIRTAGDLLRASIPPALVAGKPVGRPTMLPIPGEIPKGQEIGVRLRRLGRIGRPLCERPNDLPPADPATAALLREARLVFSYFLDDFPAALAALEEVEAKTVRSDERMRLLSLRSQILLGLGERDRARDIVDYLREADARRPRRIEWTPSGYVLSDASPGPTGRAEYLEMRGLAASRAGSSDDEPTDDEPRFRLRSVPAPPAPRMIPLDRRELTPILRLDRP